VELIQRFGTVENALDHAAEVERKTYRESLLHNRDTILFSKSMATIDTNVPVEFDVDSMRMGAPDLEGLSQLFIELEFTTLLRELLPVVEVTEAHYSEAKSAADVEAVLKAVAPRRVLAVAIEAQEFEPQIEEEEGKDEPQSSQMSLMEAAPIAASPAVAVRRAAISGAAGTAMIVRLDSGAAADRMRSVLTDPA
jgi:DNA polymerase I